MTAKSTASTTAAKAQDRKRTNVRRDVAGMEAEGRAEAVSAGMEAARTEEKEAEKGADAPDAEKPGTSCWKPCATIPSTATK